MPCRVRCGATQLQPSRLLDGDVGVEHRISDPPPPQIKEPLSFHGQLQPALVAHRTAGCGLRGPRGRVRADPVVGVGSNPRIGDRHGDGRGVGTRPLNQHPRAGAYLVHDGAGILEHARLNFRFGEQQQQVGIAEDVDVHRVELGVDPSHRALRAAGLLVHVLLAAIHTAVRRGADPVRRVRSPVLVWHAIATDGEVETRVDWRPRSGSEVGVAGVPVRVGLRGRQSGGCVGGKEVHHVLRRLVEATAAERAPRVREGQPIAVVGVVAVRLAIVRRCLVCEDRLLAVLEGGEAGPDAIETLLQGIRARGTHVPQCHQRVGKLAVVHLHAALVCLGRPGRDASLITVARGGRQQRDGRVQILEDLLRRIGLAQVGLGEVGVRLAVVGNVAPQPPRLEVVVRAQEDGLAFDALGIRGGDLSRLGRDDLLQEVDGCIAAHRALVHRAPLVVQLAFHARRRPLIELDRVEIRLVGGLGALVGVVAGDAAPDPVAGGRRPRAADAGCEVQLPVGRHERALDADLGGQRPRIERALRHGCVGEEILASGDEAGGHRERSDPEDQALPRSVFHRGPQIGNIHRSERSRDAERDRAAARIHAAVDAAILVAQVTSGSERASGRQRRIEPGIPGDGEQVFRLHVHARS